VLAWPEAVVQNGYDPDEQIIAIAETNKKWDAAGIVLDCDPRYTSVKGVEQPPTTPDTTPGTGPVPKSKPNGVAKQGADDFPDPFQFGVLEGREMRSWQSPTRTYKT
jgi:hypothetical protein